MLPHLSPFRCELFQVMTVAAQDERPGSTPRDDPRARQPSWVTQHNAVELVNFCWWNNCCWNTMIIFCFNWPRFAWNHLEIIVKESFLQCEKESFRVKRATFQRCVGWISSLKHVECTLQSFKHIPMDGYGAYHTESTQVHDGPELHFDDQAGFTASVTMDSWCTHVHISHKPKKSTFIPFTLTMRFTRKSWQLSPWVDIAIILFPVLFSIGARIPFFQLSKVQVTIHEPELPVVDSNATASSSLKREREEESLKSHGYKWDVSRYQSQFSTRNLMNWSIIYFYWLVICLNMVGHPFGYHFFNWLEKPSRINQNPQDADPESPQSRKAAQAVHLPPISRAATAPGNLCASASIA